jgi:hypothetical protein
MVAAGLEHDSEKWKPKSLSGDSGRLKAEVSRFLTSVRAA